MVKTLLETFPHSLWVVATMRYITEEDLSNERASNELLVGVYHSSYVLRHIRDDAILLVIV